MLGASDATLHVLQCLCLKDALSVASLCTEVHVMLQDCRFGTHCASFEIPSEISAVVFQALCGKAALCDSIQVSSFAKKYQLVSVPDTLRLAAALDKHALVKILLDADADPNAPGPFRCWYPNLPLHAAAKFGCRLSMSLLLAASADADAIKGSGGMCDGWTAVAWALSNDQFLAAEMLLTDGASTDAALSYLTASGRDFADISGLDCPPMLQQLLQGTENKALLPKKAGAPASVL
mmetsp:Transcript_47096/g.84841  ORF Transcript_47096/g.84841 Transcript_47096/m.84841 type:complete len:236 (-) Transcript_47096:191-898(-)